MNNFLRFCGVTFVAAVVNAVAVYLALLTRGIGIVISPSAVIIANMAAEIVAWRNHRKWIAVAIATGSIVAVAFHIWLWRRLYMG